MRQVGFWFSSHSFLLNVWVEGRFSWATVLYLKQFFFHVCIHLSLKLLYLSLLLINTLRSLLSGSVKHHKLLPQHMKWTRNQPPSTVRATVWKQYTLWLNSPTPVNTLAYLASGGHWLWDVLSYSRTVETFTCFWLVEGILKVWIKEIHVSPLPPLVFVGISLLLE